MGIPEDLAQLEHGLSELIIKYEQYFLGLEKREPLKLVDSIEGLMKKYQNVNIVNTMMKFKYNSLVARYNSYRQHWNRILRLIEEGRYSRDKFRMAINERATSPATPQPEPAAEFGPEIERIYLQYLEARKACRLPTENVSRDMIAAAVRRQKPAIMQKFRCEAVDFKVVIEDGAPKIKARPRK